MTGVEAMEDVKHGYWLSVARKVAQDLGLSPDQLWVCRTCGRVHLWQRAMCADCGRPYKESESLEGGSQR